MKLNLLTFSDEDEVDVEVLSSSFGVNGQTSWVPYSDHDTEDPHSAREHLLTKLELTDEKEETAPHDPDPDNDFPGTWQPPTNGFTGVYLKDSHQTSWRCRSWI